MGENINTTIAFIGGEKRHSAARILPLPLGCTEIQVGDERLVLTGRRREHGFSLVEAGKEGKSKSAGLYLPDWFLEKVGRPGVLITREGDTFYNQDWLASYKYAGFIPADKRELLRWFGHFPTQMEIKHPHFFASRRKLASLNTMFNLN